MAKKRKSQNLSQQDAALWSKVTKTVSPLNQSKKANENKMLRDREQFENLISDPNQTLATSTSLQQPTAYKRPSLKPLTVYNPPRSLPDNIPLDRRYKARIGRGKTPIEARLDLHGMTQDEAKSTLKRFLQNAQAQGIKTAIVITGKGGQAQNMSDDFFYPQSGVLKRNVPNWLRAPEMRALVVSFEEAHAHKGGAGALYVQIRKQKGHRAP